MEEEWNLGDDCMLGSKPSSVWTAKGTRVLYPCKLQDERRCVVLGPETLYSAPGLEIKAATMYQMTSILQARVGCFIFTDRISNSVSKKACPWEIVFHANFEAGFICVCYSSPMN